MDAESSLKRDFGIHLFDIYIDRRLACYSKPVCINPSSVALGVLALAHESHLGSNPFTLSQGKDITCILVAFAVHTVGKLTFPSLDFHLEIDVEIDGW